MVLMVDHPGADSVTPMSTVLCTNCIFFGSRLRQPEPPSAVVCGPLESRHSPIGDLSKGSFDRTKRSRPHVPQIVIFSSSLHVHSVPYGNPQWCTPFCRASSSSPACVAILVQTDGRAALLPRRPRLASCPDRSSTIAWIPRRRRISLFARVKHALSAKARPGRERAFAAANPGHRQRLFQELRVITRLAGIV